MHEHLLSSAQLLVPVPSGGFFGVGARLLTQVPEPRVSAGRAAHVRPALPAAPSPPAARQRACEQEQPVVVGEVPGVRDCPFCLSHSVECGRCAMAGLQNNHCGTVLVGRTFGVPAGRAVGRFTAPLTGWMLPNQPPRLATVPPRSCAPVGQVFGIGNKH